MPHISSKSSSKEHIMTELPRAESKDYRQQEGSAERKKRQAKKTYASVPAEQSECTGSQKEYDGKRAESEASSHKECSPSVSCLSTPVADLYCPVHHIRIAKKALIGVPGEEIREHCHQSKESEHHHCGTRIFQQIGLLLGVHICKEREAPALLVPCSFLFSCSSHIIYAAFSFSDYSSVYGSSVCLERNSACYGHRHAEPCSIEFLPEP